MNNPFVNVGAGDTRRKALMQQLAQQAANRHQQNSNNSRFGSFSEAQGADYSGGNGNRFGRRGGRQGTPGLAGGGLLAKSGGGSGLNFTDAFSAAQQHGQGNGLGNGQGVGQQDESSAPGIPVGPPGQGGGFQPGTYYGPGNPGGLPNPFSGNGNTDPPPGMIDPNSIPLPPGFGQGPSAPQGTAPGPAPGDGASGGIQPGHGGLVPLGGGVYFDPATGMIQGVAGGGTAGAAGGGASAWRGLFG